MSARNTSAIQNNRYLVSFFYVWSTGNDLYRLCSYIYLADDQFICVRMFLNFLNLSDYDLVQISIQLCKTFYLCSGKSHCICIFLRCYVKIRNIRFNP